MAEERDETKAKCKKQMRLWTIAVIATFLIYAAIEWMDASRIYEAGRERERVELKKRTAQVIDAGERHYSEELGIWIIPDGPKHIKAQRPERMEAKSR